MLCDCKCKRIFITQQYFSSSPHCSLAKTQRTENFEEMQHQKKKKKNPLDPYVLIWQRMHSLYLGEWSSETLLFPTKLQPMNLQKIYSTKGSNFFVEWHIDFMFVRVRIAKNGCEFSCSACNLKPPWQPPIFINWKITDILPPADP